MHNTTGHNRRTPSRSGPFKILTAVIYAVVVLLLAVYGGSRLYQRLRQVALADHPYPRVEEIATTAAAPGAAASSVSGANAVAETAALSPAPSQPSAGPSQVSMLLLGTDERPEDDTPPRTDTMLLVTLDPQHRTAGMLSLPRDLWVPIPGYNITTKINTAYVIGENRGYPGGGPQLAKDTVGSFIGRPVQYYVRLNFSGFVRLVDLIGGIDVDVLQTIHDEKYPTSDYGYELFHIDAGRQHLDGATALKYVRTRYTDNDYKRAVRQQQVIQAVMDKVLQADMVPTLIARAPELMVALRDSVETDIPLPTIVDLANYVRQHPVVDVRRLVLNDSFGEETYSDEGAWILVPDRGKIRPVLSQFFATPTAVAQEQSAEGVAGADLSSQTTVPAVDPGGIRLEILNGTGYPGIAARTRELLEARGWRVVAIGDADRSDYRRTLLVNYRAANTLLERINADLALAPHISTLTGLNHPEGVDLRIIVGQDFLKNVLNDVNQ